MRYISGGHYCGKCKVLVYAAHHPSSEKPIWITKETYESGSCPA